MKRWILLTLVFFFISCDKEPKANFENRDYYQGNDYVNHPYDSPCLDYFILTFKDGVVNFIEAYHDSSSPKRWREKSNSIYGSSGKKVTYWEKEQGTYYREGDIVVISGLKGSNYIGESIEFTKAEIRGEAAGTVNIDVYYNAVDLLDGEISGKINFIGKKY
ncbi:MAG: hypothetical protein J6U51_06835 [Bacteroidales bacterium]|nr:hypothetical protein [Bacteroidales bacterium]